MPQVVNYDVGSRAFAVGPREPASMSAGVQRLANACTACGWCIDNPRQLNDFEALAARGFFHRRNEMLLNRATMAHVPNHQCLLHCPGIIPIYKSAQPIVAVLAASRIIVKANSRVGLLLGLLNQRRWWTVTRAQLCAQHILRNHLGSFGLAEHS